MFGFSPLPRSFYSDPAELVARNLVGKVLVRIDNNGERAGGVIVETEAYAGNRDAACHSYKLDKPKPGHRTEVMFGAGGYAYVYLIYGMYCCFNVVSGPRNSPEAVLIRAIEPLFGQELMHERRNTSNIKQLCNGPGKLCMALDIALRDNKTDLCGNKIFISDYTVFPDNAIISTPRINVSYAGEAAALPFRFVVKGSPYLSRPVK